MFEVDGEGSSTTIQTASIERNLGSVAFQILLVTDGGVASLLNSTILSNNPVEVRPMYFLVFVVLGFGSVDGKADNEHSEDVIVASHCDRLAFLF